MDVAPFVLTSAIGASLVLLVVIGAALDLRSRRIPNWLTASGLMLALVLRGLGGIESFGLALGMATAALLLGLPLFILGGLGGGDVKFLAAIAAFLEPHQVLPAVVLAALAGAVIALAGAARRGVLLPLLLDAGQLAMSLATFGRRGARRTLHNISSASVSVPYGLAIGVGALMAWFI